MHWQNYCLIIALIGICSSIVTASDECAAPPPCSCSGQRVDCYYKKLNKTPSFRETEEPYSTIELRGNNITRVEAETFSNLSTSNSLSLVLDYNPISYIDEMAFAGLENTSLVLFLRYTKLLALPRALATQHLSTLYITGMQALDPSVMLSMGRSLILLDIDMQGMTEWPEEMKYLTNLNDLFIRGIPSLPEHAFDGFRDSIRHLEIVSSTLTHSPDAICNLNYLNVLALRTVHIHILELIPTCQRPLITVSTLYLSSIGLPYFPNIFSTFPRVSDVVMDQNNIRYIDDQTIPSQNEITGLNINYNSLTTIPYAIRKMKKLQNLHLYHNKITSVESHAFYNMSTLAYIRLDHNPLAYISEFAFINCSSLNNVDLSNTELVTIPRAVLHLPNIQNVHLDGTKIECSCDLHRLSDWKRLDTVHFYGNCYQSTETISDFVRNTLPLCHTSPIG